MRELEPAGQVVRVDPPEGADLKTTLQWICLLTGTASLLILVLDLAIAPAGQRETWVAALMASVSWLSWWILRAGLLPSEPVAAFIVLGVLATATFSVISFGSVRTAVNFLFVGAVVGAGIFLGRKALLSTWLATVAVLAILTWAEATGSLGVRTNFEVGVRVWVTQAVALAVVALIVMHSRTVHRRINQRLRAELERRRQTEHERDRSLLRFARFFRTSPIAMVAQSASTGLILDVNPAFERVYGYRRDDVLGRNDHFLWAEAGERDAYREQLQIEKHVDQYRARGRRADGSVFEAMLSSEVDSSQEDKLIISTVIDITRQEEVLRQLRQSEERFSKAFNFSPLNLSITRLSDGTFIEVNRAGDRAQGLAREELKGRTSVETGSWLAPEDRETFVAQLQRDGHVDAYETRMRHRDGSVVDVRLWAELIELEGETCILSCATNISEEKRRRTLLLELAQGVAAQTGEAFFDAVTYHLSRATGADMVLVAERQSADMFEVLSGWRNGKVLRPFSFSVEGTPCADTLEVDDLLVCATDLADRYPHAPQLREQGYHTYMGQALRDADGGSIGILLVLWRRQLDVETDMRALVSIFASRVNAELRRVQRDREIAQLHDHLEQRVRERTAELQALNAELDAFAYSVSHDLKSPLRAIDGFTQLLREQLNDRLEDEERMLFDRVQASTQRMGDIIRDLLALARVSQGELMRHPVDLSALAHEVLNRAIERDPTQRVERRFEEGVVIQCDARLARIAFENLLGNALKYSRPREVSVIEWGLMPAANADHPRLFVRDNGVGFDMAYAGKLFKPFQRLHREREFEGSGIGLATVRRILERHGGEIRAEGRPGEGACFVFSFGPESATPSTVHRPPIDMNAA